ncbi:hypothetical protein GE061_019585 [Apolygus lucorum]|uniref:MULE transposase domain-containing protein n=1 Tax=Apolygus lucorum TaxID=248454 RepID=A0A8S9X912_APOLU|nr:hypothetical protein GE061_019585 [Apolygus lucorum]
MKDDGCAVVKCPKCKKNVVKVGQKMMGHKCVMVLRPNAVIKTVIPPKPQKQQKCVLMKCPLCEREVLQKDLVKSGGKILGHECKVNEAYVIPDEDVPTSGGNLRFSAFSEPQSSEMKSENPAFIQTPNQSQINVEAKSLSCDGLRDISCHHLPKTKGDLANSFVNTNQSDSCISNVDSWVKEQMDKGVVRFYKPEGSLLHSHPDLLENDLIIMILNEAQCAMLKQYSADCVCIDVIKELKNDFELVTVMVLDEQGQGLPCCFMLTNRVDSKTMEILFNVIKTVVGYSIEPSVLVTDVSPVFWSAWNVVMRCVPLNWLFSTWQVDATWRKGIESLIRSVDKRIAVQKALTNLYLAADEMTFTHLLGSTLEEWGLDQDTADFSSYFISEFSHNVTNWAYCYRKHLGEKKILNLELLHTVLESIQQLGSQSNGLDSFIMDLMKFIEDNFKNISTNSVMSSDHCIETTSKISEIKHKHREARFLKISQVTKTIKGWSLLDGSDNMNHEVTASYPTCDCKFKCDLCRNDLATRKNPSMSWKIENRP